MKTIFITGIAVLFLLSAQAQLTIPNAGFENWTTAGSYENPDSWDSPNDVTSSLGKIVVEKEATYVHSGSYAAMITVQSSFAGNLPGCLHGQSPIAGDRSPWQSAGRHTHHWHGASPGAPPRAGPYASGIHPACASPPG